MDISLQIVQSLLRIKSALYNRLLRAIIAFRARAWPKQKSSHKPLDSDIIITGYLNENLGIGRAGRLSYEALKSLGRPIVVQDLRALSRNMIFGQPLSMKELNGAVWFVHANAPEAELALHRIDWRDWQNSYRITYWAWETSLAPRSWVKTARYFDEIWVISQFVYDAFAKRFIIEGEPELISALRLVPLPIQPTANIIPQKTRFGLSEKKVSVLCLMDGRSGFSRKNPEGAIKAWLLAFPEPCLSAELILKFHHVEPSDQTLLKLATQTRNRADIKLLNIVLRSEDIEIFIASADIILSLHRAEGFGLVLAEAMFNGVSVLATGYSGNMSFMYELPKTCVNYSIVASDSTYAGKDSYWAEPDYLDAANKLKLLIQDANIRKALAEKSKMSIMSSSLKFKKIFIESFKAPR
jgi:glycosyltransferase involved in cell wall biosynthesis